MYQSVWMKHVCTRAPLRRSWTREGGHYRAYGTILEALSALHEGDTTKQYLWEMCHRNQQKYEHLNAYISTATEGQNREERRGKGGLLEGIPIAIKDNFCVQGTYTTAGSRMLQDFLSPYDATCVSRLKDQGALCVGKTNMDEFGMGSASYFSHFGPCKNPYSVPANGEAESAAKYQDEDTKWFVPGGSSGGSAIAVATGSCFAALGSDTGGSVRQPAAFCGIVGLKPTYGAISRWGLISYASSFDTPGIFARSVADAALIFDIVAGRDDMDLMCQCTDTGSRLPKKETLLSAPLTGGTKGEIAPPFDFDDDELYTGKIGAFHPALFAPGYAQPDANVLNRIMLQSARNDSVGSGEDWGVRDFDQFYWPPPIDLEGFKVGIPSEFNVKELSESTRRAWLKGIQCLRDRGATIFEVSLPHIPLALSAYYVLASAEASSNLSRYDGLRYGYNHQAHDNASAKTQEATSDSVVSLMEEAMDEFKELNDHGGYKVAYRDSRSQGFGQEVQRRLMVGNYVLSENARGEYFDAANEIRCRLKEDFDNVFRREGVHVLLAPTAPTEPWTIDDTPDVDPVSMYANDVMTVPINLASLPSMNVPVGMKKGDSNTPRFPIGLQLIGRPNGEAVMSWAAAALERQAQFSLRYPHYIE
eukprot:gb/GECG01016181.1/.p1 GENE.gb/GECG01016181.1/~~gb/GECG01016181.1/.p1  ORF type:complete len:646 (+),score=77.32 gb/GECG01016181.1/:1-1938(+)